MEWWTWTPGASWRTPHGPGSTIEGLPDHPVVHVAYEDAAAFAAWVGSFPANDYGLFDMAGNVWEWTNDWYALGHASQSADACCAPTDPRGAEEEASFDPSQPQFRIPRRVVKGGSFLCADSYCLRYRPAARRPQPIDTGMSHIGFRCVRRP